MRYLILCLAIPGLLMCGGGPVTSNRYNDSIVGTTGSSTSSLASFGQLSISSAEVITIDDANTWVSIPFDTFSPSLNTEGSTTSPASITILESGTYQLNISLRFSAGDSPESTFNQTTYTLGTGINQEIVEANASLYAGEPAEYSLNYSVLREFNINDSLQFYIEASVVGGHFMFDNVVTIQSGNAHVIQIAQ